MTVDGVVPGGRVPAMGGGSQTIAAVERAADVLLLFSDENAGVLGVTEIADLTGFSKAVVHRILNSLKASNFITVDPETKRYGLGPAAVSLGLTYLEGLDVRTMARPVMAELGRRSNETVTLSIRHGWERSYIDQVIPSIEVRMVVQIGETFPLHAGASSKAMLAALSDAEVDEYLERELRSLTDNTVVDPEQLRAQLAEIRESGYAISRSERRAGAAALAAAILDHEGDPVAAMSISGPLERFGERAEEYTDDILGAASTLSRALGHRA